MLTLSRPGLREVTVLFGLLAVGLFAASVTVLVMVRRSRRTLPPETEPEEEARLERRLRDLLYLSRARRATKREVDQDVAGKSEG